MDSGTVQRASGQRGIGGCRLRAAVAIEVDAIFIAVSVGLDLGCPLAASLQSSGFPCQLVITLLGLDALGSGEPRNQRIQRPFPENARKIHEIEGPVMRGPIKFFEIKLLAFVKERNEICRA